MRKDKDLLYIAGHNNFFDQIIKKKRLEIVDIINIKINDFMVEDVLDIGTTEDSENESSNLIVKNLKNIKLFKSLSNQRIKSKFFSKIKQKSITDSFTNDEINDFKSDLVISSAVIEHVGNNQNQIKMIDNMSRLSKKLFILTTPNRGYPLDFHTKIPFLHWLPKKLHRKILKLIGLNFFSNEENLNLLTKNNLKYFLNKLKIKYEIIDLKLFGFTSNFIVIGKIEEIN